MSLLKNADHQRRDLLGTDSAVYKNLYALAGEQTHLPHSTPHQLRHGGASVDALEEPTYDAEMMDRGGWRNLKSIARYRRPSLYLRRLEQLTSEQ